MLKYELAVTNEEAAAQHAGKTFLCIELNEQYFTFMLLEEEKGTPLLTRYFPIRENLNSSLGEVIEKAISNELILADFDGVTKVIYNFTDSNILPSEEYKPIHSQSYMKLVFGDTLKGLVLDEKIPGKDMYNIYRVPADIHTGLQKIYKGGNYWHIYSLMVASYVPDGKANKCTLVFYPERVLVMVHINDNLQLINSYQYQTPEDIAYYLLSVCRLLNISSEEANIAVYGLIDFHSAISTELNKYFRNVLFGDSNTNVAIGTENSEDIPPHYFSNLQKLALCV